MIDLVYSSHIHTNTLNYNLLKYLLLFIIRSDLLASKLTTLAWHYCYHQHHHHIILIIVPSDICRILSIYTGSHTKLCIVFRNNKKSKQQWWTKKETQCIDNLALIKSVVVSLVLIDIDDRCRRKVFKKQIGIRILIDWINKFLVFRMKRHIF